jgi:hypothetical protein
VDLSHHRRLQSDAELAEDRQQGFAERVELQS